MNPGIYGLPSPTVVAKSVDVYEFFRSSAPPDASGGAGSWVWTPPANAKTIEFLVVGPGAGGGSGRRGAAGEARWGGGGGASGGVVHLSVPRSLIYTPITMTLPAGGAGGAAQTADNSNGNGGSSTISTNTIATFNGIAAAFAAPGGGPGAGGTTTAGSGGSPSGANQRTWTGSAGANSSVTTNAGGANQSSPGVSPLGGAAGGGISAANVAYNGGNINMLFISSGAHYWRELSVINPSGNASTTAGAMAGYDAPIPGFGGAGGGASANGFNSGKGGNGGDGFVRITCWY